MNFDVKYGLLPARIARLTSVAAGIAAEGSDKPGIEFKPLKVKKHLLGPT